MLAIIKKNEKFYSLSKSNAASAPEVGEERIEVEMTEHDFEKAIDALASFADKNP